MADVLRALAQLLDAGERVALATVVRASGSTPQSAGARLLLRTDDSQLGTVGGGAIEDAVLRELRSCLSDGKPRKLTWDLTRDLGMCCGGQMEVFVECIESDARLIIFGAGHVAQATAPLAARVGFSPWIVDAREELNSEARFPACKRLLLEPREARSELAPGPSDWLLIVSHDHRLDEEALDHYAALPHAYLGMIGSRRKIARILQRLQARGRLPDLSRVYTPVGLNIGAVTPDEIAVSLVAELIALKRSGFAQRGADPGKHRDRSLGTHLRVDAEGVARMLAVTD